MPRVPVEQALAELERPAGPRPEFADDLLRRLLAELEEDWESALAERPRKRLWPRRYILAVAAMLAVVGALVGTVLLARPSEASAAEVIAEAQDDFADIPPLRVTVRYDLNPEGGYPAPDVPQGATAVIQISYRGSSGYRQEILDMDPVLTGSGGPGSFIVWDGRRSGEYRADTNEFNRSFGVELFGDPLRELSWNAPYPDWEEICRLAGSEVLPDAEIAGRPARHVRCGDFKGGFWELWVDADTGFMLKIAGELGRDDFRLGTSPKGGFEVETIEYDPAFPAGTFAVVAPAGAEDVLGEQEAAFASVPSFRATVSRRLSAELLGAESPDSGSEDWVYVDQLRYRDDDAWRREVIEDSRPDMRSGLSAGSYAVWDGTQVGVYYAGDDAYSVSAEADLALHPLHGLSPQADSAFAEERCEERGDTQVAGRPARQLVCEYETSAVPADIWLDADTGLYLRIRTPDFELEVVSIEYEPSFAPGTFEFVPPPGSRDLEAVSQDPYTMTDLVRGELAPVWSGPVLGGGTLDLEELRGRPVLVFVWADWCDQACFSSFPAFEEVSQERAGDARFVSVDFLGSAEAAKEIMRAGGYAFTVVDDSAGKIGEAWGIESVPVWVALDADGRVSEVRLGPQTGAELEDMLGAAGV